MTGGELKLSVAARLVGEKTVPNSTTSITLQDALSCSQTVPFGTDDGECSIIVAQTRGLGPGASETLNLFDGSLLDIYGDAATFRTLRSVAVWVADGGDSSGMRVEGGASNPHTLWFSGTTPGQNFYPDSPPVTGGASAGVAVSSSACNVKVTNNGAVTAQYAIVLAGSSTAEGSPMGLLLTLTYP